MTKNKKTNFGSAKKKKNGRSKQRQKGGLTGGPPAGNNKVQHLARLINDPCFGPTENLPFTDASSIIKRVKSTGTLQTVGANNSGYLVWYPAYHNRGSAFGTGEAFNMLKFEPSASSTRCLNSIADPMGTTLATSGRVLNDPLYPALNSATNVFREAATMAACLKVRYLGTTSNCQGEVCMIENLSLAQLCSQFTGLMPSVDEMFTLARRPMRITMEDMEVKWSPNGGDKFRGVGREGTALSVGIAGNNDSCMASGTPASAASELMAINPAQERGIVFAWRGLPTGTTGNLRFEATKVVRLETGALSGFCEARPPAEIPSSYFAAAVDALDRAAPMWRETAAHYGTNAMYSAASSMRNRVVNMVMGGSGIGDMPRLLDAGR